MEAVTIIIPSFNHAEFLNERLNSIENQTYKNWVAIIIDDCSTDSSIKILNDFVNRNKTNIAFYLINENNSGSGYHSWKKGIELSQTSYIWIAETDDFSDVFFLEKQVNILNRNQDAALVFCASQYIDRKGDYLYNSNRRTHDLNVSINEFKELPGSVLTKKLPIDNYITNGSSVVFRKPNETIPMDVFNNKQCSDIFLWTYLVQNRTFVFNNSILNFFRQHENSTTKISNSYFMKSMYLEKFKYLLFFEQTKKIQFLLDDYTKNYVIVKKDRWFDTSIFNEITQLKKFKRYYFYKLAKLLIKKIYYKHVRK
ncbi:glycosyltransferase family A protein [Flavobacterium sp. LAR06]|uniref:glycosyltransferase family A protein n=1 Tax=Flavobacterium sp. LAR06 TaxID=3064897 RepID=UPI0035C071A0